MPNLATIKGLLQKQEKKVEEEIKSLEEDDPVLSNDSAESSEPGTDSWMADVHSRATAVKKSLEEALTRTRKALINIKTGKYGTCERCGKKIEEERLKVMPDAMLCISCSSKTSKK